MKTVMFDEARTEFEKVFQLAAKGETVVIQREQQRVALRRVTDSPESEVAPPGYFAQDYSPEEIAEMNTLATQAPGRPVL